MITVLTWVSIITGGVLVLLLLLSLIGGLDLDLDVDIDLGEADVETDAGGLGLIKGFLTFISVSSWMVKILLVGDKHPGVAIGIGIACGLLALALLHYLLKALLKNESNVNWSMKDALFQKGEVYLRIPGEVGNGIVYVDVNGARRELKAKSFDSKDIKTGATIVVMDIDGEFALVRSEEELKIEN